MDFNRCFDGELEEVGGVDPTVKFGGAQRRCEQTEVARGHQLASGRVGRGRAQVQQIVGASCAGANDAQVISAGRVQGRGNRFVGGAEIRAGDQLLAGVGRPQVLRRIIAKELEVGIGLEVRQLRGEGEGAGVSQREPIKVLVVIHESE